MEGIYLWQYDHRGSSAKSLILPSYNRQYGEWLLTVSPFLWISQERVLTLRIDEKCLLSGYLATISGAISPWAKTTYWVCSNNGMNGCDWLSPDNTTSVFAAGCLFVRYNRVSAPRSTSRNHHATYPSGLQSDHEASSGTQAKAVYKPQPGSRTGYRHLQ